MLQNIRDNARGFGALLMLGLLILAFAVWGIDFQFGANTPVVQVNGEEVPNNQLANAYNQQIQRYQQVYPGGIPELTQAELKNNVIESFVRNELLTQHMADEGYQVSDAKVWESIRDMPGFQADGEFNIDQFAFIAQRNGLSEDGLFRELRKNLVLQQLTNSLMESAFVTPDEARLRGSLEKENRYIREMRLTASGLMKDIEVDAEAIAAEYELNQSNYTTEERVTVEYIELDPVKIAEGIEVSDEVLRALYDEGVSAGNFSRPEERNARHVLISTGTRDDAAALSEAQAVRARIIAGEDFATVAEETSDDAGTKINGGSLGWSDGAGFVGPFRDALNSMTVDQISEPIKTRFGYHIIKVDGIRGNDAMPFEEARESLSSEYRANEARDRMNDLVNEIDDVVYEIDDSLVSAAEVAGVEIQTSPSFGRNSGGGIAGYPAVRDAAFSDPVLVQKLNSTSIELDGKFVYLRNKAHAPSRTMSLEEVSLRIETLIKQRMAAEQAAVQGAQVVAELQGGADLATVAADNELTLSEELSLQRIDRGLPAEAIEAIFAQDRPAQDEVIYDGVKLTSGDYLIYALSKVEAGDPLDEAQADNYSNALANIEFAAYIANLREKASVVVKADQLKTN